MILHKTQIENIKPILEFVKNVEGGLGTIRNSINVFTFFLGCINGLF
jgi:hypothetical protein